MAAAGDCNETDDQIHPGMAETCATPYDDNCDNSVNDNPILCTDYWQDFDGDGFGSGASECLCGEEGLYTATAAGDCDETTALVNPNVLEVCTALGDTPIDENCDGTIDESTAVDATRWYADADGDTFGDAQTEVMACIQPVDHVGDASDCDDTNELVNPVALETCATPYDDDCNFDSNEADADSCVFFYADEDGDGFGDTNDGACLCVPNTDYVLTNNTDCDDTTELVSPVERESCATPGIDDDCTGTANDEDAVNCIDYYFDEDGDGYGTSTKSCLCAPSSEFDTTQSGDCNDDPNLGPLINPGALEVCTSGTATPTDEDCDGTIDESDASDASLWFRDADNDGYGTNTISKQQCAVPTGYVSADINQDGIDDFDCNDGKDNVNPGAEETCATGYDDDCNGESNDDDALLCTNWYLDTDEDGHGTGDGRCLCFADGDHDATIGDDCNDANPDVHPLVQETCRTLYDDDCDQVQNEKNALYCDNFYYDFDGDEYGIASKLECRCAESGYYEATNAGDCDDTDVNVNPGQGNCGFYGTVTSSDAVNSITGSWSHIASGDFNGDGLVDLAIGLESYDTLYTDAGAVWVYYGNLGTGGLQTGSGSNADAIFSPKAPTMNAGRRVSAGDVDGDGNDDLLIMGKAESGTAWLLKGPIQGALNETDAVTTFTDWDDYGEIMGDLTGDGAAVIGFKTDASYSYSPGDLEVFASESLSAGSLTMTDATWSLASAVKEYAYTDYLVYQGFSWADLDGDGDDELAGPTNNTVKVYDFPQSIASWESLSAGGDSTCGLGRTNCVLGANTSTVVTGAPIKRLHQYTSRQWCRLCNTRQWYARLLGRCFRPERCAL